MSKGVVLIVDDDVELSRLLQELLAAEGYETATAGDSASALETIVQSEPDLVLLDIVLGDEDGRQLLADIRCLSDVPVVFVTGRGHEIDRITGLKLGADDYVVKPFSPGELAARVETVLRRSARGSQDAAADDAAAAVSGNSIVFGPLRIDRAAREVWSGERRLELTAKEFDLLVFLATSPRQVFSRAQLLDHVWNSSSEWQAEATVTEHIRRLRRKVEADPERPQFIRTVRSVGYRFEPAGAAPDPASPGRGQSARSA